MVTSTRRAASLTLISTPPADFRVTAAATVSSAAQTQRMTRLLCIANTLTVKSYHMSTKFTLLAASLAAVTALAPLAAQGPAADAKKAMTDNATKAAGLSGAWTPLFDGKSLAGWRGYKKENASETRWLVDNGMLTLPPNDGKDTRGARDIITTGTYDSFELRWEWKA